jgi:hypothetical protein
MKNTNIDNFMAKKATKLNRFYEMVADSETDSEILTEDEHVNHVSNKMYEVEYNKCIKILDDYYEDEDSQSSTLSEKLDSFIAFVDTFIE